MAKSDYYDELDLRYPEIAICIDRIDRTNPGTLNFYIPVLTPNLDTTSLQKKTETVHQNSSIIANEQSVNISNIQIQNYIPITVPKELCAFVGGDFNVKNVENMTVKHSGTVSISGSTDVAGPGAHTHSSMAGTEDFSGEESVYTGILNSIPTDEYRYIEPGSKWIVVFIGGDIGKPQLIGRYTDPVM